MSEQDETNPDEVPDEDYEAEPTDWDEVERDTDPSEAAVPVHDPTPADEDESDEEE